MRSTGKPAPGEGTGAPGHVGDVRRGNLTLVLSAVAAAPAGEHLTRAQVAAATQLTKASVSSLIADLMGLGLVTEVGVYRDGERGRPGTGLSLDPTRCMLGMEINVDYLTAGLVNLSGVLVHEVSREHDHRSSDPARVFSALAELVTDVRTYAADQGMDILGAALAVPGLVDERGQRVLHAPNLGWDEVQPDAQLLAADLPLGLSLYNEANASALAQQQVESSDAATFLFVSGEVGIGAGLVIDGELYLGPRGHAGELGHLPVDPDGVPCSCGGRGCLETVAGQDAIFRAAGIQADLAEVPGGATSRSAALAELEQALLRGDGQARRAVARAGRALGVAIAAAVRLVDLPRVVLGGHFVVLGRWILPELLDSVNTYAPLTLRDDEVQLSPLGRSGAMIGAAHARVRLLLESPHRLAEAGTAAPRVRWAGQLA